MSKRLVDIDDELLARASAVLGTSTMKEAVNRSLEAVVLADRRRRHADRLEAMEGSISTTPPSWRERGAESEVPG